LEITKRNHYNPCFWTAFWNSEYYSSKPMAPAKLEPREQLVNALNVKSNKIYITNVENVHFDKDIGLAEITLDSAKKFCKKYQPDKYKEFCRNSKEDQYPIFLDFEDILTGLEGLRSYKTLLTVIKSSYIVSIQEKTFLAAFVYIQAIRSHAIMNSALEWNTRIGIEKFEYIYLLKWGLANRDLLMQQIGPLIFSKWRLYKTTVDKFPLTDSPVLINPESVMIALSPRLLLEIQLTIPTIDDIAETVEGIDDAKLDEFRQRTIGNTFREIIFSNRKTLEEWKETQEFVQRVEAIQNMGSYNVMVAKQKGRELWHLNALGNQNFQNLAPKSKRKRKRK